MMARYIKGLRARTTTKKMLSQYRARDRDHWEDNEVLRGRENPWIRLMQDEQSEFLHQRELRELTADGIRKRMVKSRFIHDLVQTFERLQSPGLSPRKRGRGEQPSNPCYSEFDVDSVE